jgi:Fur family ferric uptake transcriptional regulator
MGYRVTHHRHELFGICPDCLEKGVDPEEAGSLVPRPDGVKQDMPELFRRHLARQGMRGTRQRTLIVETFVTVTDHVSVDDLLERVRVEDPTVGYATVYRTLKLLVEAGLAAPRQFGDGFTRFEPRVEEHHDHFVDVEHDRVLEFHDEEIESRQVDIARAHGFQLTRHRHDLFGVPADSHKDRA